MKKIVFLLSVLVVLALTVGSCGDNGSPVKSGTCTPNVDGSHLCVKVENASELNDIVEVKFMVYDLSVNRHIELARGDWKDGGFTIELPKTLGPNFLHPLIRRDMSLGGYWIPGIAEVPSTLTISNENVRVDNNYIVGVDKDGEEIALIILSMVDEDHEDGGHNAEFTYVDSDVTISGYRTEEIQFQSGRSERGTTTYSVSWKKGWNVWYFSSYQSSTDSMLIIEQQWSTTPISGLKWRGYRYYRHLEI